MDLGDADADKVLPVLVTFACAAEMVCERNKQAKSANNCVERIGMHSILSFGVGWCRETGQASSVVCVDKCSEIRNVGRWQPRNRAKADGL